MWWRNRKLLGMGTDWNAIGISADLAKGVAVPVGLFGTDLALWRSASGKIHLWGDRCPHRGMRLSHGFVRGERLSCIYHGWQYGQDGTCVRIPAHPDLEPPETICAQTYNVRDVGGIIWGALQKPEAEPPELTGRIPLRSLAINVPSDSLKGHLPLDGETTVFEDMVLLLQPLDDISTMVHALVFHDADKIKASGTLETLRREMEAVL